jgi:hypothetical protein
MSNLSERSRGMRSAEARSSWMTSTRPKSSPPKTQIQMDAELHIKANINEPQKEVLQAKQIKDLSVRGKYRAANRRASRNLRECCLLQLKSAVKLARNRQRPERSNERKNARSVVEPLARRGEEQTFGTGKVTVASVPQNLLERLVNEGVNLAV